MRRQTALRKQKMEIRWFLRIARSVFAELLNVDGSNKIHVHKDILYVYENCLFAAEALKYNVLEYPTADL